VSGVRLADGRFVGADIVVAAVDALQVYRDLLPVPRLAARLRRRSLSGFVMLLGVRGRTPGLAHHTVFFPDSYDAEFNAVFGGRPALDPAVFVSVPDDPLVRPAGDEAWFVLVNAPPSVSLPSSYGTHVLDVLAERGLDVRSRVAFRFERT